MSAPSFVKPQEQPSTTALLKVRPLMIKARELQVQKEDAERLLESLNTALNQVLTKDLPDAMQEAGIRKTTLEAQGNYPAVEIELKPFYQANIPVSWPEEKRKAAFNWLQENGHGDLIKTEVSVPFAREDRDGALELSETLHSAGHNVSVKENVHAQTLTAFLREQVEQHGITPPLDIIGGVVGRIAKIKVKE